MSLGKTLRPFPQNGTKPFTRCGGPVLTKDCMTYQASCWCGKQTRNIRDITSGTYEINQGFAKSLKNRLKQKDIL